MLGEAGREGCVLKSMGVFCFQNIYFAHHTTVQTDPPQVHVMSVRSPMSLLGSTFICVEYVQKWGEDASLRRARG